MIAVSPIIGGRAIKGPTAKIMNELGHTVDVLTVAAHYYALIDGFIIDTADAHMAGKLALPVVVRPILMHNIYLTVKSWRMRLSNLPTVSRQRKHCGDCKFESVCIGIGRSFRSKKRRA